LASKETAALVSNSRLAWARASHLGKRPSDDEVRSPMPMPPPDLRPHPDYERLLAAFASLQSECGPWSGVVYRLTSERRREPAEAVSGVGSARSGGRWNPPGSFPAVYSALAPGTAVDEFYNAARHAGIEVRANLPRLLWRVDAQLSRVLDLTAPFVQQSVGVTTFQMVNEEWWLSQFRGEEARSQSIGRAAFESSFEGLLVPSAAQRGGVNLIVFPENRSADYRLHAAIEMVLVLPGPTFGSAE
jgi:RES domain-containing protein